jgi:tetratricopeptide (TPR) repeat protein
MRKIDQSEHLRNNDRRDNNRTNYTSRAAQGATCARDLSVTPLQRSAWTRRLVARGNCLSTYLIQSKHHRALSNSKWSSIPAPMVSGVAEELRSLYRRGEYEALASRADQLQHRHRGKDDSIDRPIICAARAAALIQLGRSQDAATLLTELASLDPAHPAHPTIISFLKYARPYVSWVSNEGVLAAVDEIRSSSPVDNNVRYLEAQLLYRMGKYDEAAEIYRALLKDAKERLEKRTAKVSATGSTRLWNITGRRSTAETEHQLSKAELEALHQNQREIATNLMAALVLSGYPADALMIKSGMGEFYELEYNAGCAAIAAKNWAAAVDAMTDAEHLYRDIMEEEEEDVDRGLSPILVQRAYLDHVCGNIQEAQRQYAAIVRDRRADAASLAVAANNAAVATGQLAMGKHQMLVKRQANQISLQGESSMFVTTMAHTTMHDPADVDRDRHAAVFDALKKMKATSGRDVERKLTYHQRRAMARNRAILLVQMGRYDACRLEVDKLISDFPSDPLVPLIDASLVARKSGLEYADKLLQSSKNSGSDVVRAARVALAVEAREPERAIELLTSLFPGRAAAIATAAWILEHSGNLGDATALFENAAKQYPAMKMAVKKSLAAMFLRNGNYKDAAAVLNEVLLDSLGDDLTLGQLVLATSYFDADEAERLSEQLPSPEEGDRIDGESLESLPPPRKRNAAARSLSSKDEALASDSRRSAERAQSPSTPGTQLSESKKPVKKRKRKKVLPKDYDPLGPPPDPERWLPKTLRSSYKKKKKARSNEINFRGAQGADAAAADAAAVKNAERSAARVAETAAEGSASRSSVPKGTKNKKKKSRR